MPTFRRSLDPLFHPSSVAVIGASADPRKVGGLLLRNLLDNPFGGVVYPVNPNRAEVQGVHCYPSLAALPQPAELAVIATPAATVPAIARDCAAHGVKGAIIVGAGFAEMGAAGRKLADEVTAAARGRFRVIGPNCLGVIRPPGNLNASFARTMARPGRVALLSQSGAICTAVLDWALEWNIGFSGFVSVGSMLDVDFADLLDYFGDDPETRSIILYMESIGDVRAFLSAARNVARTKQVIVLKAGRHEAGARAAASHTGALAGSDEVFDAAFRRAGVLRVDTIPDLFHMSEVLATQPQPKGPALAVITNAGGPGVMATDALMLGGGELARLGEASLAALNAALPPFWSRGNPVDLLGDATPGRYQAAVEVCARDPGVQGLLILLTPQALTDPTETARQIAHFASFEGKPVLACWMGGGDVRKGQRVLSQCGIPNFHAPEDAVAAFLHLVQYRRNQELLYERPAALPEGSPPDQARARSVIAAAHGAGRTLLTEAEAKKLLSAYGIPITQAVPAATADEAVAAAERLGYPVVLKLLSQSVTHKSDVGGVRLNLGDAAAVRAAFEAVRDGLAAGRPDVPFEGVTVQPMVRSQGYELIVGSTVDPQFGPVVLFGAGGVLVEVFADRALTLPPLNRNLARQLIGRTRIAAALRGVRGRGPVDMEALEVLLVRFSQLLCDLPEVQEVDMNPVLASPQGVVAVDARVVLGPPGLPPEQRPKLAIQPYPNQYTSAFRLFDGAEVVIRAIRPEDESMLIDFHHGNSARTIRMRFFSMLKTLSRETLVRLCHLDYDRDMALVAVQQADGGGERICGVSRFYLDPQTRQAEFAVVVGDAWQGKGLGYHLMQRLISVARDRGVKELVGSVLAENATMLRLTTELGFRPRDSGDPSVVDVRLPLA